MPVAVLDYQKGFLISYHIANHNAGYERKKYKFLHNLRDEVPSIFSSF